MENTSFSPASSITSLPDDVSDFSDSDFDMISSSDSTRSHEEDFLHSRGHYSDDETDESIEPSLLLDREWYGVIDPTRPQPLGSRTIFERPDTPQALDETLSDEDANVFDALSQSLERSEESIRASLVPVSTSVANLHFTTSPKATVSRRSGSSALSRSLGESTPSSSVLQLAFPDPLPAPSPEIIHEFSAIQVDSPREDLAIPVEREPLVSVPPEIEEELMSNTAEDLCVRSSKEELHIQSEMLDSAFDYHSCLDQFITRVSKHLVGTMVENKLTASVIVSVIALIIGGATYLGVSPASPLPTPSLVTPSPTLWGLIHPINKSVPIPQSAYSQTLSGPLKDIIPLSLFPPWGGLAMPPSGPPQIPVVSGVKRKRGCPASQSPVSTVASTGWLNCLKTGTITEADSSLPTLTIDPPRKSKPGVATTLATLGDFAGKKVTGSRDIAHTIIEQVVTPSAAALYDTVSEDVRVLLHALDDLSAAVQAQTAPILHEMTFRHSRAKENARKLRKRGETIFDGVRRTSRMNAREVKEEVRALGEGVREGFKQRIRVRKRPANVAATEGGAKKKRGNPTFKVPQPPPRKEDGGLFRGRKSWRRASDDAPPGRCFTCNAGDAARGRRII